MKIVIKGEHDIILQPEGREWRWLQKIAENGFCRSFSESGDSFDFEKFFYALYRLDDMKRMVNQASDLLDTAFEKTEKLNTPSDPKPIPEPKPAYDKDGYPYRNEE